MLEDGQLLAICTAYEQGYGKGQQKRDCKNPYSPSWDCDKAWQIGYDEGIASRSPGCSMTDDEAAKLAWEKVKKDCDLYGLTVGELACYHGFFMWGWGYRKKFDEQRVKS